MSRQIEYLNSIIQRIQRIQQYVEGGQAAFLASPLIQDAVIRNFEIIGEISRYRLSEDVKRLKPEVAWRQVGDFRNTLIHEYNSVDLDIVWNAIEKDLPSLSQAVSAMIVLLQNSIADESKDSHEPTD